jgi:hypothetical protein
MKNLIQTNRWLLLPASLLLMIAGCENHHWQTAEERDSFPAEDDTRSYRRVAVAQAAAGARLDGTLHDYHFEGNGLNSLGEARLELMLKDNSTAWPIVVYVDVADAKLRETRQQAIAAFLRDAGLLEAQYRFEAGPNPGVTSPAYPNLVRLNKTESESGIAAGGSTDKPSYGGASTDAPAAPGAH